MVVVDSGDLFSMRINAGALQNGLRHQTKEMRRALKESQRAMYGRLASFVIVAAAIHSGGNV